MVREIIVCCLGVIIVINEVHEFDIQVYNKVTIFSEIISIDTNNDKMLLFLK